MPVIFVGHGSPENGFVDNEYGRGWERAAKSLPKPKFIISVSAHWVTSANWKTSGTAVTAMEMPRTIHDFYGFPGNYYSFHYKAKGSPKYAEKIKRIVKVVSIGLDKERGLDHGTWVVLKKMYPKADIPVLQLSLDENLPLKKHFEIGKELARLRREGALIMGSGNVVHNLAALRQNSKPYSWARDFDAVVKKRLEKCDAEGLINYGKYKSADLALPTNEHYLPLLYALGAGEKEKPVFFNNSFFAGSVSMRSIVFGST